MLSNNNSSGGKLRKVLASMCSLFVGASGVSQANPPGTVLVAAPNLGRRTDTFGFGDFGWKLASDDAKKEDSWLNSGNNRYQRLFEDDELTVDVGFVPVEQSNCVLFCVWYGDDKVITIRVPKGILFDVMRYFEGEYFPNDDDARNKGTRLSCAEGKLNEDIEDGVFLRFILWAFCNSEDAISPAPDYNASFDELKNKIFEFVINLDDPKNTGDEFEIIGVEESEDEFAVLQSGYLLESFNRRVREVYNNLGYDVTEMAKMANIISQLNGENQNLEARIGQLIVEKQNLEGRVGLLDAEKENLQKSVEDLNTERLALQERVNLLSNEKAGLQLQLNNLDGEKQDLNARIGLLSMEKENLQKLIDEGGYQQLYNKLGLDHRALQQQFDNLNVAKQDLEVRVGRLNSEKINLQKQLGDLDAAQKGLEQRLNVLGKEKGDLEQQLNALNGEKVGLQQQLNKLDLEHKNLKQQFNDLSAEKEKLKNQKRISSALGALIGLIAGGALVEGAHRFLGAKRSRSSEVNNGKTSSNEKGEQRAKRNLKRQKS